MNGDRLRLCVLGDFHYERKLHAHFTEVAADVRGLAADAVLSVGDLTTGSEVGGPGLLREALAVLRLAGDPLCTVVGNHDLDGSAFATDEEHLRDHVQAAGRAEAWYAQRFGAWTGVFLSTERFRGNPVQRHEIYLSPRQLRWFDATLASVSGPVFVVCHAPPLGCGLRVLPELHVRAGNAYVNQNHAPGEILDILADHRKVLLWFSGHSHLGQHHADSVAEALGILFVHCGPLHPQQAREGVLHSRVVELAEDRWLIRTFDHQRRALASEFDRLVEGGTGHRLALRAEACLPALGPRSSSWKGLDRPSPAVP